MDAIYWVACANIVVWLGLGCYVGFLAQNQRNLRRAIEQMEIPENDK